MSIRASYSSAQIEDDAVMQAIAGSSAFDQADLNVYTPGYGRTEQPWRGNLLVLGNAAARFDPIGVSQLQMLRADIHRLLELLPAQADAAPERQEFNRRASAYQASALDFATAIFELNGQRTKDTDLSDHLAYRLELFRASGRLAQYDEEAVDETAWHHLLDGCAIHPRTYAIQADQYPVHILLEHAEKVRQNIIAEVSALPTHQACLARLQSLRTQN